MPDPALVTTDIDKFIIAQAPAAKKTIKHIYFCRHGLSELGKIGLWAGSTDTPLASEGWAQAKAAGIAARELHIDYIISSPLIRARDTALTIAAEIGFPVKSIEINALVVERDFGELEETAWNPELDLDGIINIESSASVLERARRTYDYIQTIEADNILIVSHGAFGRALRHIISPEIPYNNKLRFQNAVVTQLL